MDWFKSLEAAYGPASGIVIFALGFAVTILWRALNKEREARILDLKTTGIQLAASASGDAASAKALETLTQRISDLTRTLEAQQSAMSTLMGVATNWARGAAR
jgi:septal ring factor EnvC (AmiA/AmiB activator)